MRHIITCALLLFSWLAAPFSSWGSHGLAINGELKYPPGFVQFDYTSPVAKKGGKLVLHDIGGFDKMNPFTLKGEAPYALETLVFDTLGIASLDEPFSEYGLIAQDIEVAEDQLSVIFTLNPAARFPTAARSRWKT